MKTVFKTIPILLVFLLLRVEMMMAVVPTGDTKLALFIRDDFDSFSHEEFVSFEATYLDMLSKLREKDESMKSDEAFLKFMFYKVHRKFLKSYEQQVLFSEIFRPSGKYDCVTGSALLALFLDDLGYHYRVVETDYHVYLMVESGGREFMMEATDPLNGFASDKEEIKERKQIVLSDAQRINEKLAMSGVSSDFSMGSPKQVTVIDNEVGMKELAGLHYYNQSLRAYNNEDLRKAYKYITVAQGIYPSKRIKNASSFIFAMAFSN
ncbi:MULTISPECIES: hypothetical protein [Reichenbachiella]|uniref:Transglutaminase-like superfamily protein n=1 Tax=Reichenbachiella agariperforans TaxID=156994 RepID=A0A1M6KUA6_REIAG|nr:MULTISPECIES: hypothetical protein [Reichenbachiella]MBU2913678.1 hypothetical protein [Reichenbachiella agariperforans]RJE74372.1 hypothetical protein BGP76_14500 [Reichenbachiella sp. MSK19-1]SHJ62545.1 hypothetical protein SAMN04488028_101711 [Reichenbachiella agariperforans]